MQDPSDVSIRFSAQRLEYILNVLAQRPYAEVVGVLADIQSQLAGPIGASPQRGNGREYPIPEKPTPI